jgi:hypothetical protein
MDTLTHLENARTVTLSLTGPAVMSRTYTSPLMTVQEEDDVIVTSFIA